MYHTYAFNYIHERVSISGITMKSAGYSIINNLAEPYSEILDYHLLYVEKDFENFKLNGKILSAKSGSVLLLEPETSHLEFLKSKHLPEFYYVHFESDKTSLFSKMNLKPSVVYPLAPSSTSKNIFEAIITELQQKLPYYEFKIKNLFENLLIDLNRKLSATPKMQFSTEIAPALTEIHASYWLNYTLDEYANMCRLSKYHFSRLFKNYTGLSPIEYRNHIRLERSKDFLAHPATSIKNIAEKCGYANANYFCDAFKKAEGISPSEYRKLKGYTKE